MFFTQEDYKKIQQWLTKNSVKDTEFNKANIPFNGEETITIVQGNQNKKVFLKDLIAQVFNLGISDFVNITDKYDAPNISLEEAIRLIPSRARKTGQVITFLDTEDHWHIYQFKGVLNQWNVLDTWEDLFDFNINNFIIDSILPDEEDLTKSLPDANGNSYLSLKDREYNPEDFSGLGRVILRKNIIEVEDPIYGKVKKNILYQDMFTQSNTIYEIRYDFDLNGEEVIIPEGCVLDFQGGSLNNGVIVGNDTTIKAPLTKIFGLDAELTDSWNVSESYPEWFGAKGDGVTDDRDAINKAVKLSSVISFDGNKTYNIIAYKDDIISSKRAGIIIKNGSIIKGNNATIKTSGNNNLNYNIICCYGIENVIIKDLKLIGDRNDAPENNKEENGIALGIHGCSNIYVENVYTTNVLGDGIYIGALNNYVGDDGKSSNITIVNCKSENNLRNALSIICADSVLVKCSHFYNTGYYSTVDLEPNYNYESIKNVRFEYCYIYGGDIRHGCFNNDDTIDTSIVEATLFSCELKGLVQIFQRNPQSRFTISKSKVQDGYLEIDSVGQTLIEDLYIRKDSFKPAIYFNQRFINKVSNTSSGTKIVNVTIDCKNSKATYEDIALHFQSGTSQTPYTYYNISLFNITLINDNAPSPMRLDNYVNFDEDTVEFNKVRCYGRYTNYDVGNPVVMSKYDIVIKESITISSRVDEMFALFEKYIFTSPATMYLKKGYAREGLYTIINKASYPITIHNDSFSSVCVNGVKVENDVDINTEQIAYLVVDYQNTICNIIKSS